MARDKAKKTKTDAAYVARNFDRVGIRISSDSDVGIALGKAIQSGETKAGYILAATIKKLKREGFYASRHGE